MAPALAGATSVMAALLAGSASGTWPGRRCDVLREGDTDEALKQLQQALVMLGFKVGE